MVGFWLVFAVDYLRQRGDWFFFLFTYCCDFYIPRHVHAWDGIWMSEEVYCM